MIHGVRWFNQCIINDDIGIVKLSEGHRLGKQIPQILDKTCVLMKTMCSLDRTGSIWLTSNINYTHINETWRIYHCRPCPLNFIETSCLFKLYKLLRHEKIKFKYLKHNRMMGLQISLRDVEGLYSGGELIKAGVGVGAVPIGYSLAHLHT